MYLCTNPGCPKAGLPLTRNTIKNHRKTYKKYKVCYKSLEFKEEGQVSYQKKSKNGESIYPRKCPNPGCPLGDQLLSKCMYNIHRRSFKENGVCSKRKQLQREKPIYPMRCKNVNCPSDKLLRKKAFLQHMQNFEKYGKCYAPQIRKKPR